MHLTRSSKHLEVPFSSLMNGAPLNQKVVNILCAKEGWVMEQRCIGTMLSPPKLVRIKFAIFDILKKLVTAYWNVENLNSGEPTLPPPNLAIYLG